MQVICLILRKPLVLFNPKYKKYAIHCYKCAGKAGVLQIGTVFQLKVSKVIFWPFSSLSFGTMFTYP